MKSNSILKVLALVAVVLLSSSMLEAQPGGFPGGQPPMGEGGRRQTPQATGARCRTTRTPAL